MAIQKGATVRQIVKPIEGVVAGFDIDRETGETLYRVEWEEGGEPHARYFKASEVEAQ